MYDMIEHDLDAKVGAGRLTAADADLVREWLYEYTASHHCTEARAESVYRSLIIWADRMSLSATSMGPVYKAINEFFAAAYKQNTRRVYIQALRSFLLWRAEAGFLPMKKVAEIKIPSADRNTRNAADMITKAEYDAMIAACRGSRNKAIIATLYEGGFRPVEIRRMKWKDVQFDMYGAIITTSAKTEVTRTIRVMTAASYLARWEEETTAPKGPDDLVITTMTTPPRPFGRESFNRLVQEIAKAAGIERKITPYVFRHTSITNQLVDEVPESVIKLQHWGTLSTQMLSTYAHLTHQHVDDVLLARAGVRKRSSAASQRVTPSQCPKCHRVCAPTYNHCPNCGCPLTDDAVEKVDTLKGTVLENVDTLKRLLDKIERGEIVVDE